MLYREIDFNERKPLHPFKEYFFMGWSEGIQIVQSSGYISNMEEYQLKCDKLVWLEPESDYDPDAYRGDIGKNVIENLN